MDHIALQQSLGHSAVERPYLVEGIVSGTIAWHRDADGARGTIDGRVHPLHLRHAAMTGVQVPEGRVQDRFGRDRDGTWWGHELAFLSDDLTIMVHQGQVRLSPASRWHRAD